MSRPAAPAPVVAAPPVAPPAEPVPVGPLPRDVHPVHEALVLDIDPAAAGFHGTAAIQLHLDRPRRAIWLHGRGLRVRRAAVQAAGAVLPATWTELDPSGVVQVALDREVAGDVELQVAFDADYDPTLVGVYRVKTKAGPAVFSKFEAIYARRAFPSFDEPAFKLPWDVTIHAPAGAAVIGNMPVADQAASGGRQRVTFATTPALPSYLVAFAVGPFETRATTVPASALRPRPLPLGAVAIIGRGADTAYALAEEPRLLAEQERYFDVAFPFAKLDLIAVPDFQSGAMENAGAITFRDSLLLVDDKITSLEQKIQVASVVAHETAHQWFGDLVTMAWWDDLWLNEGFATFLAGRTMAAVHPEFEVELGAANRLSSVMRDDSLASARRIRQPIETPHDITNAFDGITYSKGAAVLTMVSHFIGEAPFRRGLHEFLVGHASGNATTAELVAALSAASGQELAPLVASFLDQPGVPAISVTPRCEAGAGSLALAQARWRAAGAAAGASGGDAAWTVPVCVKASVHGAVEQKCAVLTGPTGTLPLSGCADWVLPNADAAGYYRASLPPADLARLRDRGMAKLSTAERLNLGHDLEAGFASGVLPADQVLRALAPFARDPHGAIAVVPLELLGELDDDFVDGAARAALRRKIVELYAPVVARVGWAPAAGDTSWRRVLRSQLLAVFALRLEEPRVLAEAARRGRRLLGLDRDHVRHADAVSPDLAGVALAAAARTGGAEVFDALRAELASSDDAQVRQRLLAALASTRDPALLGRALDLSLDPSLRANERTAIVGRLLGLVATRDLAWAWTTAHFDALAPMLPDRAGGALPGAPALCDEPHAAEVRAFFAPRVERLTGGPRNLALALERATQCAARVAAQRDAVARYLRQ
ncbi:MAG TPA: M1 family metallopeptidase [Kofleriaceae bacterium]